MKKLSTLLLTITLLFSTYIANAQKMKIVRCSVPSIIINGDNCSIGDTFNMPAEFAWTSDKQVIIAKDEKGRLVRFAPTKGNTKNTTGLFNRKYNGLATRDFDECGIDGTYIIDKELILPTGLDGDNKYTVEIHYTIKGKDHIYKAKLLKQNSSMVIKKNIFKGRYNETIKAKIIAYEKVGNKEFSLSNNIEFIHIERALMPN